MQTKNVAVLSIIHDEWRWWRRAAVELGRRGSRQCFFHDRLFSIYALASDPSTIEWRGREFVKLSPTCAGANAN